MILGQRTPQLQRHERHTCHRCDCWATACRCRRASCAARVRRGDHSDARIRGAVDGAIPVPITVLCQMPCSAGTGIRAWQVRGVCSAELHMHRTHLRPFARTLHTHHLPSPVRIQAGSRSTLHCRTLAAIATPTVVPLLSRLNTPRTSRALDPPVLFASYAARKHAPSGKLQYSSLACAAAPHSD